MSLVKNPLKIFRPSVNKEFWALKDVNFDIEQGEIVGIIGKNGAGKSTLLKILSRITEPTSGQITMRGRVSSLLEVGTGFHAELTGRENIYLNGSILGMKKKEIQSKFEEIVEFSGVSQFLDTPVKRYSSGMYVRLAFAVAAHLEPEILIVDEVLAVGDLEFQKKSLGKMKDVAKSGKTILFVSHNMSAISSLCTRAILLNKGQVVDQGETNSVVSRYVQQYSGNEVVSNPSIRKEKSIEGDYPYIKSVTISDQNGKVKSDFDSKTPIKVKLEIETPKNTNQKDYAFVWFLHDYLGEQVAVGSSFPMSDKYFKVTDKSIEFTIYPESLLSGSYFLRFVFHVPNLVQYDDWTNAISFEILKNDYFDSGFNYPSHWSAKQFVRYELKP